MKKEKDRNMIMVAAVKSFFFKRGLVVSWLLKETDEKATKHKKILINRKGDLLIFLIW